MPVQTKPRGTAVRATPAPVEARVPAPAAPTPPIEIVGLQGVAPGMISSLPPMASGNDAYTRQFYRSLRVPFRRYLPIRSQ